MFARKPGKGITLEMYIRNTQVNKKKKKKKNDRGAGEMGSAVKSTGCCSSRGVSFPAPHSSTQPFLIPVPGTLTPSSDIYGQCMNMVHRHTGKQKHPYK